MDINVTAYRRGNEIKRKSRETGNRGYTRRRKTKQYVMDTTML